MNIAFTKILFLLSALCAPTRLAMANEYLVSGYGAPRSEFEQCNRDIPAFEKALREKGLVPIERIFCVNLPGETESFTPSFRTKSEMARAIETVNGARFTSLSYCEMDRLHQIETVPKEAQVLESTCKRIRVPNLKNTMDDIYQASLVLLKPSEKPGLLYNSAEVLMDSVDSARVRAISLND